MRRYKYINLNKETLDYFEFLKDLLYAKFYFLHRSGEGLLYINNSIAYAAKTKSLHVLRAILPSIVDHWYKNFDEMESKVTVLESLFESISINSWKENIIIFKVYFSILKQLIFLFKNQQEESVKFGRKAIALLEEINSKVPSIIIFKIFATLIIHRADKEKVSHEEVYKLRREFIWFVIHFQTDDGTIIE